MGKLNIYLKNISLKEKLRFSFILVVLVPMLFMGGYLYYSSISYIEEQLSMEVNNVINRNILEIENAMQQVEYSITYLASNSSLQEFLTEENLSSIEISSRAQSHIGPLLYNILLSNGYFEKLTLYTYRDFPVLNDLIKPINQVEKKAWFPSISDTSKANWRIEKEEIFVARPLLSYETQKNIGVIQTKVKAILLRDRFRMLDSIPMVIEIYDGTNLIYTYTNNKFMQSNSKENAHVIVRELTHAHWQIKYIVNNQYYSPYINKKLQMSFVFIMLSLILVGVIIRFLTKSLLKRIFFLVHNVTKISEGNWNIQIDSYCNDEIGILEKSFNSMVKKINHLINEVYEVDLSKKRLELEVLKSKINPHFLYNNLSTINWIALEKKQYQICEITNAMATFYRTALNDGKDMCTVEAEINNIKSYIDLQKIAKENRFQVVYNIPENLKSCKMPNFILQPIVENAIEHGINHLREKKGNINISFMKKENDLFITVKDNVDILYSKIGNKVMEEHNYGYGLKNVSERIKLQCGKNSYIEVKATKYGTEVTILLKKLISI